MRNVSLLFTYFLAFVLFGDGRASSVAKEVGLRGEGGRDRYGRGTYPCAAPPLDRGAPVSPPAMARDVVVKLRMVGRRAFWRVWRYIVELG